MSATDELRRLLDERGIEWKGYKPTPWTDTTAWDIDSSDPRREVEAGFIEFDTGVTLLRFWNATPEQAVAATLGTGTCHMELREDARTSAYQDAYECSKCGEWVLRETFMGESEPPRFCPNCGRRVVSE